MFFKYLNIKKILLYIYKIITKFIIFFFNCNYSCDIYFCIIPSVVAYMISDDRLVSIRNRHVITLIFDRRLNPHKIKPRARVNRMDASEIVVRHAENPRVVEDGHERNKSHIQIENPTTAPSIVNPDSFHPTTEYERALAEIADIINNSDNTFKHTHVNVIWKHLTVRTPQRGRLILGERRRVRGINEPDIRRTLPCPFPKTPAPIVSSENCTTDIII